MVTARVAAALGTVLAGCRWRAPRDTRGSRRLSCSTRLRAAGGASPGRRLSTARAPAQRPRQKTESSEDGAPSPAVQEPPPRSIPVLPETPQSPAGRSLIQRDLQAFLSQCEASPGEARHWLVRFQTQHHFSDKPFAVIEVSGAQRRQCHRKGRGLMLCTGKACLGARNTGDGQGRVFLLAPPTQPAGETWGPQPGWSKSPCPPQTYKLWTQFGVPTKSCEAGR